MARINESVFDAGPFIHLQEVQRINLVALFKKVLTTTEILGECKRIELIIRRLQNVKEKELTSKSKDLAKHLLEKYCLDLGEATGIALCKQENIKLFFTDDLEARGTAHNLGFEPHGTIAIILRAYREKLLTTEETKTVIEELYQHSTLFFTMDLRDWTIKEIDKFKRKP